MRLLAAVSALALSACAVGPNYVAPTPPAPATGAFLSTAPQATSAAPAVEGEWWRLYKDPVLDRLVAEALQANTDVRVAVARLERARASLREVRADRTPQVNLGGSAQYGRLPSAQRAPGADREDWFVDTGLDIAYEVDLFGRVSRNIEAAKGDVGAAAADADAVRVAVAAETTRAYADAVSSAERLDVAQRIVTLLDRSTGLMRKREEAGLTTPLDTARIRALREQRQAEIPLLQAQRESALFRLATLTGRAPRELPDEASSRTTTLRLDQPIPVGDGTALLARRPDVRAAERRLAAATARIGVATADLYPRITLGGSIGSSGAGFGNVFGAGPFTWLLGPLLNWSLNQAPARARVAEANADSRAALAQFDGTVLQALEETETALSGYARILERRAAL
ncbi:MAG TPA: TolC family protein, partial [Sphingomonas sp.]|nr:TolC family protein [Sphingomonas sp.]